MLVYSPVSVENMEQMDTSRFVVISERPAITCLGAWPG